MNPLKETNFFDVVIVGIVGVVIFSTVMVVINFLSSFYGF